MTCPGGWLKGQVQEELFEGVEYQQMYGVEPVEEVLGGVAFLVVVEGEGHYTKNGGGLPAEGYGGSEEGQITVVAEDVHQGEGKDAFVAVVSFTEEGYKGGGGDHEEAQDCAK